MNATNLEVIGEYLRDLDRALSDLPRKRRQEIVTEVEDHIFEAFDDLPGDASEAAVRNVLDRLGDPGDIAADARERLGIRSTRPSWSDPVAIVLLLIGGFLWVIGWIAGVVLLWLSDVWSTRDKIIGTFVVPGGLLAPVVLIVFPWGRTECTTEVRGNVGVTACRPDGPNLVAWVLLTLLVVAPIWTAVHLGRKLRVSRQFAEQ